MRWRATVLVLMLLPASPAVAVDPGSQLVTCDRADDRIELSVSSHLDPSCTWTRGIEIVASDVTLDCQGAHIAAPDRRYGVHIFSSTDVALSNIAVRNCHVEGFLNNYHIEREGFRDLAEGVEYEHAFSNILIEDSTSLSSRGVGIFVNGYVTGVTLRNLHVEGAGSAGIYLEAGSKDNVVENSTIVNNGYTENGPNGQFFEAGGANIFFWGIGREGLSIDGSRNNVIRNNQFGGNSAGGIFLYKNCGEFVNSRPERWFHRRYGADGNVIEGNTFVGEDNGVWIASRMGENISPMQCSDPQYRPGYARDYADDTVVRGNDFQDVTFGVRVEDDRAVIEDNTFTSSDPAHEAVVLGTRYRTTDLGQPVDGTVVTGNQAFIAGNLNPYRWNWGHTHTTFTGNESLGRLVGMCEGVPPAVGPFVFVVQFVVADPEDPPVVDPPPTLPPPAPLPPCPAACATGAGVADPRLTLKRLDTPPGDDALSFDGRITVSHPFSPPLDPVAVGVGIAIEDATGARIIDTIVPGGAYDRGTRVGWKTSSSGTSWKFVDGSDAPVGGIVSLSIKDRSRVRPGEVQIRVKGKRGAYAVQAANLPLTGFIVLDPPTAETGQCGQATFAAPGTSCAADGKSIRCR